MIRALIGRFVMGCLDAHATQVHRATVSRIDLARMTDADISDLLHGRRLRPDSPGLIPFPSRGARASRTRAGGGA